MENDLHTLAFYSLYYGTLEGAVITRTAVAPCEDGGNPWPILHATLKNGEKIRLEVSRDEEGNGAGFMFGITPPTQEDTKQLATQLKKEEKTNA